jgi:carboxypeptidase T
MPLKKIFLLISFFAAHSASAEVSVSHKYSDIQTIIQSLAQGYPKQAQLFTLGATDSGSPVDGMKIGNGPVHHLVVATHHGNEYGSTEVTLEFARNILEQPLSGMTVFVIPVLNIDGFNHHQREELASGVSYDPNRNYPGPCGGVGPFTLKSTKALADLIDRENIIASATLHTHSPSVTYPWGVTTNQTSTAYDSEFISLAKAATYMSGYDIGTSTDIVYPANGAFEDYAFWKFGVWSLLFELGHTHTPDLADLQELVRVNVPGLRKMLETAPTERAPDHEFKASCADMLLSLDRHDE